MSLLHHRSGLPPFEELPVSSDREAELLAERRRLRIEVAALRRENGRLEAERARFERELEHARHQLRRRWWQR